MQAVTVFRWTIKNPLSQITCGFLVFFASRWMLIWRRERGSNPRYVAVYTLSRRAPSTTRPSLQFFRTRWKAGKDNREWYLLQPFTQQPGQAHINYNKNEMLRFFLELTVDLKFTGGLFILGSSTHKNGTKDINCSTSSFWRYVQLSAARKLRKP